MNVPAAPPAVAARTVTRVVVDASVAVKWFLPEVNSDAAKRLLRSGLVHLAPDLIWSEVANALWRKWKDGKLAAEAVEEILRDFRRFPLQIHPSESLYDVAWPIAQGSGRTFYDSLYLALAMSTGCRMVTADLRFVNALHGTPWEPYCVWVEEAHSL